VYVVHLHSFCQRISRKYRENYSWRAFYCRLDIVLMLLTTLRLPISPTHWTTVFVLCINWTNSREYDFSSICHGVPYAPTWIHANATGHQSVHHSLCNHHPSCCKYSVVFSFTLRPVTVWFWTHWKILTLCVSMI